MNLPFKTDDLRLTHRSSGGQFAPTFSAVRLSICRIVERIKLTLDATPMTRRAVPALVQRFNGLTIQRAQAFTLIEMLTVIAIIGIIASLSVPVIKNFGQANVTVSASRQMLDDIGRARQLAMSDRTTVYMVFVPTNFWAMPGSPTTVNSTWYNNLTKLQLTVVSNLFEKQLTGYTFIAYGALGDQPGRHTWHYLAPWQSLPDGSYIPLWKFYNPSISNNFSDPANGNFWFNINSFSTNGTFPFPTEDSTNPLYSGVCLHCPTSLLTISDNYRIIQAKCSQPRTSSGGRITTRILSAVEWTFRWRRARLLTAKMPTRALPYWGRRR